jgi:uncharacterized protein YndB with AHSA1/START domain
MSDRKLVAHASTTIDAPADQVWEALTNPSKIKQYMFGTTVASDWKKGSPITWKGQWQGKAYEDKGRIVEADRPRILQYSHYSPLTGAADRPENYHNVTIELSPKGKQTVVSLSQDNNENEEDRKHSEKNWGMMLEGMKKLLERR